MFNSKYSNVLTIILVIVIIIILGLLAFLGFDIYKKYYIDKETGNAVDQFQNQFKNTVEGNITNTDGNQTGNVTNPLGNVTETPNGGNNGGSSGGSGNTYKGYEMLGTIEIPKTNVRYPILADISAPALATSVVYLYGPGLNEVGNSTISGHNYRNGLFFSNNKKLNNGDKIYITDNKGIRLEYTIYNKYETDPNDADYLTRNTNGAREISLSTCNDDSSTRIIIWAKQS